MAEGDDPLSIVLAKQVTMGKPRKTPGGARVPVPGLFKLFPGFFQ